ncbi:glycosyltransferase [Alishewanella tabrizica]|uniref:Glycosyl transferase n=1 Tax=Alishewanella tabrizica TaxID=671278 RepID=A0ABQ2WNG4_9ALTE|nr:glycosyltransferase [Alishewanella tabrizica]GGW62666.1 glycosyl transferase [Alishewanella tabrizica]
MELKYVFRLLSCYTYYNNAQYINDAIEGALAQEIKPKEIIVLDDGSTDNTEQVLKIFSKQIKYKKISNQGCGTARRHAIELSSQPYIALCDSDDIWQPNHISRKIAFIDKNPEFNFLCSNFTSFGPEALENYTRLAEAPDNWVNQYLTIAKDNFAIVNEPFPAFLKFNIGFPSGLFIKRTLYNNTGGIRDKFSRSHAEDTDFTRRAILCDDAKVAIDLQTTWSYRRTGQNMSTVSFKNSIGRAVILQDLLDSGYIPTIYQKDVKLRINECYLEAFRTAYWSGLDKDALSIFKMAENATLKDKLRYVKSLIKTIKK